MKNLFIILLILFTTNLTAQPLLDIDTDNDGLIEVSNIETLNAIRHQSDGSGLRMNAEAEKLTTGCAIGGCKGYELTRDLDFLDAASYKDITNLQLWTSGAGWQPIGDSEHPFNAVFKTNNSSTPHTIFNLTINRSSEDNVGLFGSIGSAAEISGIGLLDADVTGRHRVGGLVGVNGGGQVSNSYASGHVVGSGGAVGLLVGSNSGAITNSYADGEVSGKDNSVGGLVGVNSGNLSNSYAMGNVVGKANNVGGLVGDNSQGTIINSYASASVSGSEDIGGLVGLSNLGTLVKNYVSGKATGIRYVGGLVGMNIGGTVSYSYWDKTTSALEGNSDGVGLSASELQSASAQNDDLNKPFYQWSTADWDFGSDEQYPILKYATGTDANNPACGPEPSLPNCGSLLLGQHSSLKRIILLADATLTPRFKPTQFNYHLNITPAIKQLQLIPIANNPNSVINISTTSTAIATDLASGTTSTVITLDSNTEITIAVSAPNQRPAQYRLTVNYLPTLFVDGILENVMDEGRMVVLDAYSSSDTEDEPLSYQWTQSVGKAIDLEETDQPILILRIPEDYVSEHASSTELGITVAVSDGKATASQDINIHIRKIDNGTITVAAPTPSATAWTAPKIDLSDDPDGVGGNLQYQWQSRTPGEDAEWTDIDQATQPTYTPSILTAIGTQYRVRISYTDGQGYETTLAGDAATYQPEIVTLDFAKAQATDPDSTSTTSTTTTTEGSKCSPTVIDYDKDGLIDICDLEDLNAMRYQLDGTGYRASAGATEITTGCPDDKCNGYELMRDLDFLDDASYSSTFNKVIWTTGAGWQPIGYYKYPNAKPFKAIFDGNDHTISNLMTNSPDISSVGLFGYIASASTITNIGLLNVNIQGDSRVGGLVGLSGYRSSITNSYATGTVTGRENVGGLVGESYGSNITNSYATGTVTGRENIGGLVGESYGSNITNSYAMSAVEGSGNVGGLVGDSWGNITDSYATGAVTGYRAVGGLVGYSYGNITNSYATGAVRGISRAGGLIGENRSNIMNSYATGAVTGNHHVGGLVGNNETYRDITNSYATGAVTGNHYVGGLVGDSRYSRITNSYWDTDTSRIASSYNGIGKPTVELQQPTKPGTASTDVYYGWSSDDWDFGSSSQYPVLKKSDGTLLSPMLRYGLSQLRLAKGHLSPDFVGTVQDYTGLAVNSTSTIQLIPTVIEPSSRIHITGGGMNKQEIASDGTSDDIKLSEDSITTITIVVTTTNQSPIEYNLNISYYHFPDVVDKDGDGLIEINSIEELNAIRYQLDGTGYRAGETALKIMTGCPKADCRGYELTTDLSFESEGLSQEDSNWSPIRLFSGTFEGNHHTISNLKINQLDTYYVGLFGSIQYGAKINNIGLLNVNIQGNSQVGGLVGQSYYGSSITNSYMTGVVRGNDYVGGLVGQSYYDSSITNSYATGVVRGNDYVGGLVGYNYNYNSITNSYATGVVRGNDYVGGLVGQSYYGSSITNSYATGAVTGNSQIGGLVGQSYYGSSITNSYATGVVRGNDYVGGLVGNSYYKNIKNSYWDIQTSGIISSKVGIGKTTAELQKPIGAVGIYSDWSSNDWDFGTASQYPVLKKSDGTLLLPTLRYRYGLSQLRLVEGYLSPDFIGAVADYTGSVVNTTGTIQLMPIAVDPNASIKITGGRTDETINSGDTSSNIRLSEDSITTLTIVVTTTNQTPVEYNLNIDYYHFSGVVDNDGDGLIEIDSIEKLKAIRYQPDGSGYREGETTPKITEGCPEAGCRGYELTVDLSLASVSNWSPIVFFSGTFEGNGNTISNLKINRLDTNNVGLFGSIQYGAKINNIGLLNVNIQGNNGVGSLVGNSDGNITNSYATGAIRGSSTVGGLVGINRGNIKNNYATGTVTGTEVRSIGGLVGDNDGNITNSYATGTVTGTEVRSVGGLVGTSRGDIINSYATGTVTGNYYVGGLVGSSYHSSITNSYATGTVTGNYYVGGLFGWSNDYITNSYATGAVRGSQHTGGLVGWSSGGSITNSYATGAVTGDSRVGGLVGSSSGSITNSYATGAVTGRIRHVGGLVGYRYGGNIKNSYWDTETSEITSSAGGSGRTKAQLQSPTDAMGIYSDWSSDDWDFGSDEQYPVLKYATDCGTSDQPACGTLLPDQYSLLDDLAVANEILSPEFNSETFRYEVEVNFDVDTLTLHTTATGASIRISSNLTPTEITNDDSVHTTMTLTIAAPTVITIEVTKGGLRPTRYQLHVTHRKSDRVGPIIPIPEASIDDGEKFQIRDKITLLEGQKLEVSFANINCESLRCDWYVDDAIESLLLNRKNTNKLTFKNIPADFLEPNADKQEFYLKFAARNNVGTKDKDIILTINKKNNGPNNIELILEGRSLSVPEINDPDRGVASAITYQWQREEGINNWVKIDNATAMTYTIPQSAEYAPLHRVQISYTDGQGHNTEIYSQPIRNIDVDDDGLIEIKYLEELYAIRYQLDGTGYKEDDDDDADKVTTGCPTDGCEGYELIRDLDFKNHKSYKANTINEDWTTSTGWEPIEDIDDAFSGIFKGNGYTISNLMINRTNSDEVGLFAKMKGNAEIDGVSLYKVNIRGEDKVGALVGFKEGGKIANVGVDGMVLGINGGEIGGVAGVNDKGKISLSYSVADVTGKSDDNKMGKFVGGLVGINKGRISNSYATGDVTGDDNVGGLVGYNEGNITKSYAISRVMGNGEIGNKKIRNLVGNNLNPQKIENSYWNTDINDDITGDDNGVGLNSTAMKATDVPTKDIYNDWSRRIWDFGTEDQYPVLKYRSGECSEANSPNYCGDLLAGQRIGLQSLELSLGAILLEDFASEQLNYTVLTDRDLQHIHTTATSRAVLAIPGYISGRDLQHIHTTATAASPDAEISIRSTDDEITITVTANNRTVKYILAVERLTVEIKSGNTVITEYTFTEGEQVKLKASLMKEYPLFPVRDHRYLWSQPVGKGLVPSMNDKEMQELNFTIPANYVGSNTSSTDVTLIQKMTVGEGNQQLMPSAEVTLTINKKNNDTITTAEIGKPSLDDDLQIIAPDLSSDRLLHDSDGENANPAPGYQWQWWNKEKGEWGKIPEDATNQVYQVPTETEDETRYRVLISYTDGQGYRSTTASDSITFIDIDRDNDGLIEIEMAKQLNAIRHQLDGSGYSSSGTTTITLGCPVDSGCIGYELKAHIDLKTYSNWQPIGNYAKPFNAIFKGNHYTISNLTITTTTNYVGLFAATTTSAEIYNVGLLNVEINANDNVGGLVGNNEGIIDHSHVIGKSIAGQNNIGGLVGNNKGTIKNSHVISMCIEGASKVGALIGFNNSDSVDYNYATMDTLKEGTTLVCKLIGNDDDTRLLGICPDEELSQCPAR